MWVCKGSASSGVVIVFRGTLRTFRMVPYYDDDDDGDGDDDYGEVRSLVAGWEEKCSRILTFDQPHRARRRRRTAV